MTNKRNLENINKKIDNKLYVLLDIEKIFGGYNPDMPIFDAKLLNLFEDIGLNYFALYEVTTDSNKTYICGKYTYFRKSEWCQNLMTHSDVTTQITI